MLNSRITAAAAKPTEEELQALAKAAYDELLAQLCTEQRSTPYYAEHHTATNLACADYYDRLAGNGGHMSLLPEEERKLAAQGWSQQRIADLRTIVQLRENENITRFQPGSIDAKLRAIGFEPTDELRWMAQLVLYPAFRDAHIEAEASLQRSLAGRAPRLAATSLPPEPAPVAAPAPAQTSSPLHPASVGALPPESAIPEDWRQLTPTQAAERLIAHRPALWEHRKEGKRAVAQVGEQTLRQIRWAAVLLEKSMGARPFWTTTEEDLKTLDRWFDRLPTNFGKAPWHRAPETTLEEVCDNAEERIEEGDQEADVIGLQVGTTNKHYRKLGQIHQFMRKQVGGVIPPLDFSDYVLPDIKDERAARAAYTPDQGKELFLLSPWTGCDSVKERLEPGPAIFHDALFFVLLLVWYTGMRREEVCKLLVDDVQELDGVWYLQVRFTEAGRVKNITAVRNIAICEELRRLGFIEYVQAIGAAGHDAVFPELVSERKGAKKGDTFYKLWWIYIKPLMPSLKRGQALHAARHMVDTELKELEIFPEFRDDALGHKGEGEGPSRYAKATRLKKVLAVVNQIPIVTDHLPDFAKVRLLPADQRKPRPRRVRTKR
jgi:integrase